MSWARIGQEARHEQDVICADGRSPATSTDPAHWGTIKKCHT